MINLITLKERLEKEINSAVEKNWRDNKVITCKSKIT